LSNVQCVDFSEKGGEGSSDADARTGKGVEAMQKRERELIFLDFVRTYFMDGLLSPIVFPMTKEIGVFSCSLLARNLFFESINLTSVISSCHLSDDLKKENVI